MFCPEKWRRRQLAPAISRFSINRHFFNWRNVAASSWRPQFLGFVYKGMFVAGENCRRQLVPAIPMFSTRRHIFSSNKKQRKQKAPQAAGASISQVLCLWQVIFCWNKKESGFPTPAKRVEKSGFETENAITRLSQIRLTTKFEAEYITFRGASFWMGFKKSRQSQFRDRDRIWIFEARKFRRSENFGG